MRVHNHQFGWMEAAGRGALFLLALSGLLHGQESSPGFNGGTAFEDLKHLVSYGPRPAGSSALAESRSWMLAQLKQTGAQVEEDSFTADTPLGSMPMTNLIAKFPGKKSKVVIIAGHYDTKRFDNFRFVGANDGGSSAALLLGLARSLQNRKHELTYSQVIFEGEEAVREQWEGDDNTYGSRHMVERLSADGDLGRVQALILVDMIGDAHLEIPHESNSTPWLTDLVFSAAHRLGYAKQFPESAGSVGDDHTPFLNAGVPAIDLIDFNPNDGYWHTAKDTLDHCSPLSLTIVGRVVLAALADLDKSPHIR